MQAQSYQLSDYLEKLPGTAFRKLYQQPSTAFAIFRRMLPPLAKIFVQALLYAPCPIQLAQLDVWVKAEGKDQRTRALSILRSLHIVTITPPHKDKPQEMYLTTNFRNSLRLALEGGGTHQSFGVPSTLPVDPTIDVAFLDRYARKKREDILHFIVNSVGSGGGGGFGGGPKGAVKELLLSGGLVQRRQGHGIDLSITQAGFAFLLQEANAQVWTLLLLWMEAVDREASSKSGAGSLESIDMLSFLFMLASLELGRAYDTSALSEPRRNMLPSLVDFGLIYVPRDTRQYFPTRLVTTLTSISALRSVSAGFSAATTDSAGDDPTQGSIIIETNYRLYAYTKSPIQIAVLALFTELHTRFPTMVTGRLSRESIRQAIDYGITADQIISYLAAHAHEQMVRIAAAEGKPVLPPTVVDQIRLWQLESERMRRVPGFLFKEFDSFEAYFEVCTYAEEIGILEWKHDKRQMFFTNKLEPIRDFLRNRQKTS